MRYAGQGWEIPVRFDNEHFDHLGGVLLANRFEKAYEEFFGRAIDGLVVEAIGWSVRVTTPRPTVDRITRVEPRRNVVGDRTRGIYAPVSGASVDAAVLDRATLAIGDRVIGPAAIAEDQTTTWLTGADQAVLQADGCLLITRQDADLVAAE